MAHYMYVAMQEDDKVSLFTVDPQTGSMTPQGDVAVSGGPFTMVISPDRNFLYVGCRDVPQLVSFRIDQATGGLTKNGEVSLEANPTYVGIDRKGKFVLSAYYQGAHVGVHPIGNDGSVGGAPIEWLETATGAHAMQTDPTNRYAFVPHIAGNGPNAVYQFRFDENTGHLTPNSPATVEPEAFLGPRHFCFHPSLDVLYFSNEQGCSVSGYRLDTATGTLSLFQTIPTIPEGFTERNTCSQIQVSASGRFLYAPNRGHNSIAGFRVNPNNGHLSPIAQTPTEAVPRAFSIDLQGTFLYVAGLETGKLASYRIDQDSGELEAMDVYDVGKGPMWVLTTEF